MSPITAVSQAITNLNEAERQFKLTLTANPDFFPEWQTELPPLSVSVVRNPAPLQSAL